MSTSGDEAGNAVSRSAVAGRVGLGEAQTTAPFQLNAGDFQAGELGVMSFTGVEEVNAPYSFSVLVWGEALDDDAVEATVVGSRATLALEVPAAGAAGPAPRFIHGVIVSVVAEGRMADRRRLFRLTLVPQLWLLSKRVNSRIFQDMRVHEIVDAILDEYRIERRWRLLGSYPTRQYCVQYEESDLRFVTRILAEEGVFFYFEQPHATTNDGEVVAFGDSPTVSYLPIDGDPQLLYRRQDPTAGDGSLILEERFVTDFRIQTDIETDSVVLRDYDFERPLQDLTSQSVPQTEPSIGRASRALVPRGALEEYRHHGDYQETDADAERATVHLEQLRARAREAHGASVCRRLHPGHRFDLRDHDVASVDGEYVVSAVRHSGRAPGAQSHDSRAGGLVYENTFRCVSAATALRPPRPERPFRQALESAVVVGPAGEEIFTDVHGRIKVQFHWDRESKRDEHSSCWMRVMQASAGPGWGSQFIPRIGMEVLVGFLGGDVDRPVVVGCLFNASNPPPYGLPTDASRSGIRTRTTPGGGGSNEIAFEDAAGREQLYVHAQRNLDEAVGADRSATIGGDLREAVEHDRESTVGGTRRDQTAGDHLSTIQGAYRLVTEGSLSAEVQAGATASFAADVDTHVRGHHRSTVDGDHVATVVGSKNNVSTETRSRT